MKRNIFILKLIAVLLSAFTFTSCIDDGDETVSLEYGQVRKMIVGRWKINKIQRGDEDDWMGFRIRDWEPGTTLIFFDDGTYKDSSDKGDGRLHRWHLKDRDYDDEPYYGGIVLDDDGFDFDSFGPGRWILRWPSGYDDDDDGWRIELDKESDDPEDVPDPEPEPEPEPKYIYRVKQLDKSYYYMDDGELRYESTQHYYFTYDDAGRISTYETPLYSFRYDYSDEDGVYLYDAKTGGAIKWCRYGQNGYVSDEDGLGRLTFSGAYIYDEEGYLSVVDDGATGCSIKRDGTISFSIVVVDRSGRENWYYKTNTAPNNANIDLNSYITLLADRAPYHQAAMLPFDFYGKRYPELICAEMGPKSNDYYFDMYKVTLNDESLPKEISYNGYDIYDGKLTRSYLVEVSYDAIRVK